MIPSFTLISFLCQYDSCHCRAHNVLQTFWVKQHNTKVPRQNFTLRIITRSIQTPNFQQTKTNNIKSYLLSFILLTQKNSQNSKLSRCTTLHFDFLLPCLPLLLLSIWQKPPDASHFCKIAVLLHLYVIKTSNSNLWTWKLNQSFNIYDLNLTLSSGTYMKLIEVHEFR